MIVVGNGRLSFSILTYSNGVEDVVILYNDGVVLVQRTRCRLFAFSVLYDGCHPICKREWLPDHAQ